jgi:hypothetical protein
MAEARCMHSRRTSSVLQCDLNRTSGEPSLYSTQLIAEICENCGHVELYCDFHREVCNWLTSPT